MGRIVPACVAGIAALGIAQAAIAEDQAEAAPEAAAPAPAAEPMNIFVNELGAGWEDQSWASAELGIDIGSSRKPIRVEAGPWQALYLHHAPFSTAGYRKLSLLIQSAPPGGQPVRIIAVGDGKPLDETGHVVTLATGGWTKVEIPLATLKAENATIDGLWVQNGTGEALQPFYVSDIVLS